MQIFVRRFYWFLDFFICQYISNQFILILHNHAFKYYIPSTIFVVFYAFCFYIPSSTNICKFVFFRKEDKFSTYLTINNMNVNCNGYLEPKIKGERIRCKPISLCKLWKLQSESLDQHPRDMGDWVILQFGPALGLGNHTFANPPSHLSAPLALDVDLMAQIEVFIVCMERLVYTWYGP